MKLPSLADVAGAIPGLRTVLSHADRLNEAAKRAVQSGLTREEFAEVADLVAERYRSCRIASGDAMLRELDERVQLRAGGSYWDVPELWMLDTLVPKEQP